MEVKGPRLEVKKHRAAELRLKRALLSGQKYEGMEADQALVRRKSRDLGYARMKQVAIDIGGGGDIK
jgi:hypothetical protein